MRAAGAPVIVAVRMKVVNTAESLSGRRSALTDGSDAFKMNRT
jgi:hypothetical protein